LAVAGSAECGLGGEARAQGVAGEEGGVEAGAGGVAFDEFGDGAAGHGVVSDAAVAGDGGEQGFVVVRGGEAGEAVAAVDGGVRWGVAGGLPDGGCAAAVMVFE